MGATGSLMGAWGGALGGAHACVCACPCVVNAHVHVPVRGNARARAWCMYTRTCLLRPAVAYAHAHVPAHARPPGRTRMSCMCLGLHVRLGFACCACACTRACIVGPALCIQRRVCARSRALARVGTHTNMPLRATRPLADALVAAAKLPADSAAAVAASSPRGCRPRRRRHCVCAFASPPTASPLLSWHHLRLMRTLRAAPPVAARGGGCRVLLPWPSRTRSTASCLRRPLRSRCWPASPPGNVHHSHPVASVLLRSAYNFSLSWA